MLAARGGRGARESECVFFCDDSPESDGCDAESGDDFAGAGAGVRIFIGWAYFAV